MISRKKLFFIIFSFIAVFSNLFADSLKAKDVVAEAQKKASVTEVISYLNTTIPKITDNSEKRAVSIFLASIQEQLSLYTDARKTYASAAAISGGDVAGFPVKTNEQLVIDAVRCALCTGDFETAEAYLTSSVRNSKDNHIISYVKLYTQWSSLCKAETSADVKEPVEMLKAYLNVSSMNELYPVILLTLWYITGDNSYAQKLKTDFPKSMESLIVKGDVQLLPVPFWFFVPKTGIAEQGTGSYSESATVVVSTTESPKVKFSKWQLGLFKSEANAKALCEEVKAKGFDSLITSEKRASGTTYYIVIVKENASGDVSDRLKTAGYECYPVE